MLQAETRMMVRVLEGPTEQWRRQMSTSTDIWGGSLQRAAFKMCLVGGSGHPLIKMGEHFQRGHPASSSVSKVWGGSMSPIEAEEHTPITEALGFPGTSLSSPPSSCPPHP